MRGEGRGGDKENLGSLEDRFSPSFPEWKCLGKLARNFLTSGAVWCALSATETRDAFARLRKHEYYFSPSCCFPLVLGLGACLSLPLSWGLLFFFPSVSVFICFLMCVFLLLFVVVFFLSFFLLWFLLVYIELPLSSFVYSVLFFHFTCFLLFLEFIFCPFFSCPFSSPLLSIYPYLFTVFHSPLSNAL